MNPQMNKVFSKLAKAEKTELKSEKVELASVGDLKKALNAVEKGGMDKYRKSFDSFLESRKNLENAVNDLKQRNEVLEKKVNDFSKAAKDLGLSPNSVKEYDRATFIIDNTKSIVKKTKF